MKRIKNEVTIENLGITQFKLTTDIIKNLSQFEITPTAKLVLLYLSSCYNPQKAEMFPKQKTIAKKIGVSERSVVRAIQELFREGLIIFECKYTNRYKFTSKLMSQPSQNLKNFVSDKMAEHKRQIGKIEDDKMSHHEQKNKQKKEPTAVNKEDMEILKKYAENKGAKNIQAYVSFLIKNDCSEKIIEQERAKKKMSENRILQTKMYLAQREYDKKEIAPLPPEWFELGKKLFG